MKFILSVSLLISVSAFGQTTSGFPFCAARLRTMTYFQLVRSVEAEMRREKIRKLREEIELQERLGAISVAEMDALKEQNEQLKLQMQNYLRQIDELNRRNSEVREESDSGE